MIRMEMVRQGRQFVSSGLSGHSFNDATDAQVPDHLCRKETLSSLAPSKREISVAVTRLNSILMRHPC
jgi:hypothetical protein